jgi:flavin reductase (DIM6/NTAB) family NADH-FMN oxidoreductase RutF
VTGDHVDAFSDLVSRLDPAMCVVTTVADGERAGCLVGFHAQCSIDPPRYAVWLSKANHTYRVALHAEVLVVHLVAADQTDLAELFGTVSGDDVDKFARCEWQAGEQGVPLLTACPRRLVVRRVAMMDEGSDHVCVFTEPIDVHGDGPFEPLRLSAVVHLDPGHGAHERPTPATERASEDEQ